MAAFELYNEVLKECERTNVVPPSLSECDLLGNTPRWKNVRDKKDPLTAHLGPCDMHDYAELFVSMMIKHFHVEYKSGHAVGGVGSSSSGHADVFDIRRANPNTNRGGRTAGKREDPGRLASPDAQSSQSPQGQGRPWKAKPPAHQQLQSIWRKRPNHKSDELWHKGYIPFDNDPVPRDHTTDECPENPDNERSGDACTYRGDQKHHIRQCPQGTVITRGRKVETGAPWHRKK